MTLTPTAAAGFAFTGFGGACSGGSCTIALGFDAAVTATFTALQRLGVPSRLLYFPDENHWVLKPENAVLWHDTVLDWLARWTA